MSAGTFYILKPRDVIEWNDKQFVYCLVHSKEKFAPQSVFITRLPIAAPQCLISYRFNFLYLQKQCGYIYLSIFLSLLLRRRQ